MTDPEEVYRQNEDKQRVVIAGRASNRIAAMVIYVLDLCHREFDFISRGANDRHQLPDRSMAAPLIIIQERERPPESIIKYRHHIAVISEIDSNDFAVFGLFADATPKGGVLICSETEPARTLGKKERQDLTTILYNANQHTVEGGRVYLLSSDQKRFPIRMSGEENLRNISGAKEILKKIGITSEQFYSSISGFEG